MDSSPCYICAKRLFKLGFGKIVYSNDKGIMVKEKISEYSKVHLCSSQRVRTTNNITFNDIVI